MKSFLFFSIGILAYFITNAQCVVTNSLDDSSAGSLRQTINSCAAGGTVTFAANITGDTIFLQEQPWQYSAIGIEKEIIINGTGSDITIVGSTYSFFVDSPQADNIFTIGFNGSADPSGTSIKGLNLTGGGDCITISDNGTGMVNNIKIENCTIKNNLKNGILVKEASSISLTDNIIEKNGTHGIQLWRSSNSEISRNEIKQNELDGIYIGESTANHLSNNTIESNGIESTSFGEGRGLYISDSRKIEFSNNTIEDNYKYGILLSNTDSSTFSDNYLNANGTSDDPYSNTGLILSDNSNHNTFEANTIQNHSQNGIEVNRSSYNTFLGNYAQNNNVSGITINGSSPDNELIQNYILENVEYGILLNNSSNLILDNNSIYCNGIKGFYNIYLDSTIIDTQWIDQTNILHAKTTVPFAEIEIFNNEKELDCDTCQSKDFIGRTIADENGDFSFSITGTFDNVTFSVSDPNKGVLTFSTCVKIRDEVTGNIKNSESNSSIYPNPSENKTLLPYSTSYSVYNAKGSLVLNGNGEEVDLTKQPSGMYLIKTSTKTYRIIKK